jgi:hypothetical protein
MTPSRASNLFQSVRRDGFVSPDGCLRASSSCNIIYRAAQPVRMGVSFTALFDMSFQGVLEFQRVGVGSEKFPLVRK